VPFVPALHDAAWEYRAVMYRTEGEGQTCRIFSGVNGCCSASLRIKSCSKRYSCFY